MAFIDKKDPIVLNIKLTSKGREQLSKGKLAFKYYAIGDSEIDYEFNRNTNFEPFNANILRPVDKNPKQLSFITKNSNGNSYNEIATVPSTATPVINEVQPLGFFNDNADEFLTDTNHLKQPDIAVEISGVTGGTYLKLIQAPTYQGNVNEPMIGDLLLVKWTNPLGINTTGYTINKTFPTPYLWYKIQSISGATTLDNNNLIVKVDRELPDFSEITGGSNSILAGAMVYYNIDNYDSSNQYSTDNTDDALITFLQNCQCPTITFPFWNMSIIYTENIAGVNPQLDNKSYGDYKSNAFGGFVSYIQNQQKHNENYQYNRKLGVIHYTNNSVSNTYGESFYGDPQNPLEATDIPTLDIPTIMWHKSSGVILGLQLKASGELKYLTGATKFLNARYFDLADFTGNVVGKVFYDLQIFLIEDQELLFAMSYKSNRSWTLPEHNVDINANVTFGESTCLLEYNVDTTSPTTVGGSDGSITVNNIIDSSIDDPDNSVILEIIDSSDNKIYFDEITGSITVTNANTLGGVGIYADTYTIRLIDTGFADCIIPQTVTIGYADSTLEIYSEGTTYSALNAYFRINPINNNPVHIRFYDDNSTSIGFPFGTGYVTIAPTEITNSTLNTRILGSTGNDALSKWVAVPDGGTIDVTNLTFTEPYQIFVRDSADAPSGQEFDSIVSGDTTTNERIESQVWTYYVAAGNPLADPNNINVTRGSDSGGEYIVVSNYIKSSLDSNINPIVGDIEISVYDTNELAYDWNSTPNDGSSIKIYLTDTTTGTYNVEIRERYNFIEMYNVVANSTFTII